MHLKIWVVKNIVRNKRDFVWVRFYYCDWSAGQNSNDVCCNRKTNYDKKAPELIVYDFVQTIQKLFSLRFCTSWMEYMGELFPRYTTCNVNGKALQAKYEHNDKISRTLKSGKKTDSVSKGSARTVK